MYWKRGDVRINGGVRVEFEFYWRCEIGLDKKVLREMQRYA